MFITVTAWNGESTKEVMLRKCQTSSLSSASNFSCSKLEPLSLTHQPNFETTPETSSPDLFLCGAFFELLCEKLVSLSFGIEETKLLAVYLPTLKWTQNFAFLRRHKHRHVLIVQTWQYMYGHTATACNNPLTAIN